MQKFYLLILFLFASRLVVAQTTYSHDVSGNRVKRLNSPPLPVTLISFTATKLLGNEISGDSEKARALLSWRTSSEINSDYFDIERSQDAKRWAHIGTVSANGDKTSYSDYSFTDDDTAGERIGPGENLYRLKMVDKDGTFAYSRIRSLNFGSSTSGDRIVFYPNPVKDWLKIKGIGQGKVQLLNNSGSVIGEYNNVPKEGIDMRGSRTGIYMIRILNVDGSETVRKIIKE